MMIAKEGSSLWACPESQKCFYYPIGVRRLLTKTSYIQELRKVMLSVFLGHMYLQHGSGVEQVLLNNVSHILDTKVREADESNSV